MDTLTCLKFIDAIIEFLEPLTRAVDNHEQADALLQELGYLAPADVNAFDELGGAVEGILNVVEVIDDLVGGANESDILKALVEIFYNLGDLISGINEFKNKIQQNFVGNDFLTQTDILSEISKKLLDYLFVKYLERNYSAVHASLLLFGIIEEEEIENTDNTFKTDYLKRVVHWGKITSFLSDPISSIKDTFISDAQIHFDKLLYLLNELGNAIGLRTEISHPEIDCLDVFNNGNDLTILPDYEDLSTLIFPIYESETTQLIIEVYPIIETGTGKYEGIGLGISLGGEIEIAINNLLKLLLKLSGNLQNSLGFTLDPAGNFEFINNLYSNPQNFLANAQFVLKIILVAGNSDDKLLSLGSEDGSRFEIGKWKLSFGIEKTDYTNLFIETEVSGGKITLVPTEADGFVSRLLPQGGLESNFDLGLGFSSRHGLYFRGSGGLEIKIPTHVKLGPIEFQALTIALKISSGEIPVTAGATIKANLGPLKATVENMGIRATFSFPDNNDGNLGPVDLALGFKPPNGVGLAIDAGVIKGGGYLFFDFDREEYAGALELTAVDFLSLKAIGLITTKMPDGSKGFSLIIIITAEFTVQLGYGFVFLGAGGLLGLNRTMKLQPLAEGVRSGATANIMFPTNIVENAPRIISDIRIFFPVEKDKFLIGPMVKLGWGTPTLISISLGIIIEIRTKNGVGIERIAILGVLKCILPDEEAALIVLQVNFIGAIDFEKKVAFFFASMFESRILFITIEGEMGVLVAWGADANFLVSVGGFHPRFSPPPLPFPVPKRVSLNILNKSWGKIRVEGYFAVTTNTAQFGAKVELYFGLSSCRIEGHVAFDALFQFNPFYFIIEISGKVSLKVFGCGLFSVSLKFTLEGPTPWHAKGYGKIKILFFSFKARFDKTWGSSQNTSLPPIKVLQILKKEFTNLHNWQAIVPDANNLLVSLRKPEVSAAASEITLHPLGCLRISQRAVPLKIKLDKIGSQKPEDANIFEVEVSGDLTKKQDYKESFARAQFQNLKDSKKLSSPAYEKEVGGLELIATGKQFRFGRIAIRHVRYELVTIDTAFKRFKLKFFSWMQVLFGHFLKNNAASLSSLSFHTKQELQPFVDKIDVLPDGYAVAFNKDNKPYTAQSTVFSSQASAEAFMAEEISKKSQMTDALHVIPCSEVNQAA